MPGLYFEEFEPGAIIDHATRRTVTKMDNVLCGRAPAGRRVDPAGGGGAH